MRFTLHGLYYGTDSRGLAPVAPAARGNEVRYQHRGVAEWYRNGPLGLEQGFTVDGSTGRQRSGTLTLALAVSGNARPRLARDGGTVAFTHAGRTDLSYTGLSAADARRRNLHGWLTLSAGTILLHVDTRRATYPIRIDPFVQQGGALHEPAGEPFGFGTSVALSADGNLAVIGDSFANRGRGAAFWVFTRDGESWTGRPRQLVLEQPEEEVGSGAFGAAVAVSGDGSIAVIGAPKDNQASGAAFVFTRSSSGVWKQQGPKLTGFTTAKLGREFEEEGEGEFGAAVALSGSGSTALIGAPNDSEGVGAVFALTRQSEAWQQQGRKLTGAEELGRGDFGRAVALSGDGATAMIGAPGDDSSDFGSAGAAFALTLSGETWKPVPEAHR